MGIFKQFEACPECGSRDNLGVYYDDKTETYNASCFGMTCEAYYNHDQLLDIGILNEDGTLPESFNNSSKGKGVSTEELQNLSEKFDKRGWPDRKINNKVATKYGVLCDGDPREKHARYFPSRRNGQIVGYKIKPSEKVDGKYDYRVIGSYSTNDELFGQHLFSSGGKVLVITTGQEDAMAIYQVLVSDKYETACVSVNNGDKSVQKQFQANYEFISSFNKVILFFDDDEPGKQALDVACRLLKPGQAHIAKMSDYKDVCEYKKRGLDEKLKNIFFNAERFSPVDICSLGDLWSEFENAVEDEIIELPPEFSTLSSMWGGGPAKGEVTVVGALTSVGKSTVINKIAYHAAMNQGYKTGLMYLESSGREIVRSMLSIHSKTNLNLPTVEGTDLASLKRQFMDMVKKDDSFLIVNHQGAFRDIDDMVNKLRWMTKAGGCELIIIDPLQAAVPDNSNEMIDIFMDAMLKLAKETNVSIIVVSHTKKPDDKDPHGITEYSLKGSSSINQISFNTVLLSRDKTHENHDIRNTLKMTGVKCRRTGLTGDAGWLRYDPNTVMFREVLNPYEYEDGESGILDETDREVFFSDPVTEDVMDNEISDETLY